MTYVLVGLSSFLTAGLTFFSGFGLGTLLLPVFALFFDPPVAVALTAVVHFFNNLFKLVLTGRHADKGVVLAFGVPALVAAFAGAALLVWLAGSPSQLKRVIGVLMMVFAVLEILPSYNRLAFDRKWLPLGGALSGFFGGLSGHQGALRSAFLVKAALSKEAFIASGIVIAFMVDIARLSVYGSYFSRQLFEHHGGLIATAVFSAFLGTWFGNRFLQKITMRTVQAIVTVFLFLIALGMVTGLI